MPELEPALVETLADRTRAGNASWRLAHAASHDIESADGRTIIEVKARMPGVRELIAAAGSLALQCDRSPHVERALLVLWEPRTSRDRTLSEWSAFRSALRSDLASRLRLVCVWPDDELLVPDDGTAKDLVHAVRDASSKSPRPGPRVDRSQEVLKVLARRWLLGEGPIKVADLQRESGLSHPTVARDLAALGKYIARETDRSVRLHSWPSTNWQVLQTLGARNRRTIGYEDATGRVADLARLAARLRRADASHVGVGGVVGARFWQPEIDIDGTPRLDLSVHAPNGSPNLDFLSRVDRALRPVDDLSRAAVVIHLIVRAEPFFVRDSEGQRIADPVEILLDLQELEFNEQARAFRRLRTSS